MITIIASILAILGAINWFAVGAFNFNIINWIFGANYYVGARVVYVIIGIAGLWLIWSLVRNWSNILHHSNAEPQAKSKRQTRIEKAEKDLDEHGYAPKGNFSHDTEAANELGLDRLKDDHSRKNMNK